MRVVKEAEERRNEILDAAGELFTQKGFDSTSINDILDKVGIARGTLYYHFKSKEDIIDSLIDRFNARLIGIAQEIAGDHSIPACQRIMHVIAAINVNAGQGNALTEHINKPQNAIMHQKVQKIIMRDFTPILSKIIYEGIAEGTFDTPYPYECVELLLAYVNSVIDGDLVDLTEEQRVSRLEALIFNAERLFGAQHGSMANILPSHNKDEDGCDTYR